MNWPAAVFSQVLYNFETYVGRQKLLFISAFESPSPNSLVNEKVICSTALLLTMFAKIARSDFLLCLFCGHWSNAVGPPCLNFR